MILDVSTVERVIGTTLSSAQKEKINEILIPAILSAILQFTNRSWYNAEEVPEEYVPQNPALPGEKIPDGVIVELCSIIGDEFTGDTGDRSREVKSISEGGISITFSSPNELQNKFSASRVISYYRVPSI